MDSVIVGGMEMLDLDEFLAHIRSGMYDESLEKITATIARRKNFLAYDFFDELQIGDKVRFNNSARPQYLNGATAIVTGKKYKKIVIKLDESRGRYRAGIPITTPVNIIDRIDNE